MRPRLDWMTPSSALIGHFLRISLDYCLNLPFINPLSIFHPHPKVQHLDEATTLERQKKIARLCKKLLTNSILESVLEDSLHPRSSISIQCGNTPFSVPFLGNLTKIEICLNFAKYIH
jgi:hypothetical protein